MDGMFYFATSFNQPLDGWDVSKVTLMGSMFGNELSIFGDKASTFNQPLNSWDVSMVTDMSNMFSLAISFNQPLDGWNVSSVTSMYGMFADASSFNQNLCAWGQFSSFPYEDCSGMFSDSGCNYEDVPMQAITGPFCASDCLTFAYI
jgi:surface protein